MGDTPDMLQFLYLDFSKVDIATMLGVDRKTNLKVDPKAWIGKKLLIPLFLMRMC